MADTIKSNVRDIDLVARRGGEEFGVFLPGVDPSRTQIVADRIRAAVDASPFMPDGQSHRLTISGGGATFDRRARFADLYRHADQRLYAAKRAGRNRVDILPLSTLMMMPDPVGASP